MPAGFTLIELMIVVAIVIIMSAVAIPSFQSVISSRRLQAVAWQMVQDLKTVREDAILYQQDLNVYINYPNSPVAPTDPTNRSYLLETFQWGMDQPTQATDVEHYIPPGDPPPSGHFIQRVLQYGVVIISVTPLNSVTFGGKSYQVLCFRCGSGAFFRGEADVVQSPMTVGTLDPTKSRVNSTFTRIDPNNLVVTLGDPATGLTRTFKVIVKGTGEVSMGNS